MWLTHGQTIRHVMWLTHGQTIQHVMWLTGCQTIRHVMWLTYGQTIQHVMWLTHGQTIQNVTWITHGQTIQQVMWLTHGQTTQHVNGSTLDQFGMERSQYRNKQFSVWTYPHTRKHINKSQASNHWLFLVSSITSERKLENKARKQLFLLFYWTLNSLSSWYGILTTVICRF